LCHVEVGSVAYLGDLEAETLPTCVDLQKGTFIQNAVDVHPYRYSYVRLRLLVVLSVDIARHHCPHLFVELEEHEAELVLPGRWWEGFALLGWGTLRSQFRNELSHLQHVTTGRVWVFQTPAGVITGGGGGGIGIRSKLAHHADLTVG
jgi:hypothetical protein